MIEQFATVELLSAPRRIRVISPSRGDCARCARGEGCGGGILGRLINRPRKGLELDDPGLSLNGGELVVVGLEERAFLTATALGYLLPVVGLLLGAALPSAGGAGEGAVTMGGIAGFLLGMFGGHQATRAAVWLRPRILRRANAGEVQQCGMENKA